MRRLVSACLLFFAIPTLAQSSSSLAARRAAHLRHGINLSEWFAQVYDPKGYTKEHLVGWVTPDDIALIKSVGFDHVRLSVNPEPMMRHNMADHLPPEYLGYLDGAVKMILDHGLAVIIDMHPESEFKAKLVQHDDFVEQFSDFWRAIAQHYSSYDPEMVYFEILNEPEFRDRYRWAGVQGKLAAAIREGAPQHTIIAAGANWSDVEDLLVLTPLPDANVIYNFHFYTPFVFTHQGATWTSELQHHLTRVHYPSYPGSDAELIGALPEFRQRIQVVRYDGDRWNASRIEAEIAQAASWAADHNVRLTCNEFGVRYYAYRSYPSAVMAHLRWLRRIGRPSTTSDSEGTPAPGLASLQQPG